MINEKNLETESFSIFSLEANGLQYTLQEWFFQYVLFMVMADWWLYNRFISGVICYRRLLIARVVVTANNLIAGVMESMKIREQYEIAGVNDIGDKFSVVFTGERR
jgi:hypothetical protein